MMGVLHLLTLLVLLAGPGQGGEQDGNVTIEALMPPFPTDKEDAYLCTSLPLPNNPLKLTAVEALARQEIVHHILLFGCSAPAEQAKVWNCRMTRACSGGQESVLFGWGKNAPALALPQGVGFAVGPGTATRTVVMQVHYLPIRPAGDASGVRITLTSDPVPLSAGTISSASSFTIPPGSPSFPVPNECCYTGFEPVTGFGVRVHTHRLGRSVSLERSAAGGRPAAAAAGGAALARLDPQQPQGFYSMSPFARILPGDRLRMSCDFNSSLEVGPVSSGHTSADEMCNLYMMVYSQVPYFMYCIDNSEYVSVDGAGGLPPSGAHLQPDSSGWAPPTSVKAAEGDAIEVEVPVGQLAGVAAGSNGTLWVLHRGDRAWDQGTFHGESIVDTTPIQGPMVLHLEQDTGKVLRAFGADTFLMPHMITEDSDGNIWVTDVGLHQAIKFSPNGERVMELGQRLQPGHNNTTLCKPTHVVVGRDGSIYVVDGYCNSRIVQYSPQGQYQREYRLPEGQSVLSVPHSLALHECKGLLYVADREGAVVHAFELGSGDVHGSWSLQAHGLPYALTLGPYGTVLALAWDRGGSGATQIVALGHPGVVGATWDVPGAAWPHDLALVPAPLAATGAGERRLAVVVAETRPPAEGPSRLHKLVFPPHAVGGGDNGTGADAVNGHGGGGGGDHGGHEAQQPPHTAASHANLQSLRPLDEDGAKKGSSASSTAGESQHPQQAAATLAQKEAAVAAAVGQPVLPGAGTKGGEGSGSSSSSTEAEVGKPEMHREYVGTVQHGPMASLQQGVPHMRSTDKEALEGQLRQDHSVAASVGRLLWLGLAVGGAVAGGAFYTMQRVAHWRAHSSYRPVGTDGHRV